MTLDEFLNADEPWPKGSIGFRLGVRGRHIWTTAHYPDGCSGHRVCVSRIVHENGETFTRCAYPPRDTRMIFVIREGFVAVHREIEDR